ncbi:MAG: peptidase [candidate division KSB1 bacterium]|nr:peptidase [candidate division KSB1 bacterium]
MRISFWGVLVMLILAGCSSNEPFPERAPTEKVRAELAKLAPAPIEVDLQGLSEGDRKALGKLIEAAKEIDELFLMQVDPANPKIRKKLQEAGLSDHLELFKVMFGRWNRLVENEPFLDRKPKPLGAGFYPEDMTREEFEKFLQKHPDQAAAFANEFRIIRRTNGKLIAVPYHEAYPVAKAAKLLKEASALTDDPSLAKYLALRAEALITDDYFESDMAWMDLAGDLEVVIGPYEVYEDALFNYKAAYEAFICRVDHQESEKLKRVTDHLHELEASLPIPDAYKNFSRGSSSPIKVVNEIFSAGDTKAGIQTTAFNLPNDERVRRAKGSKKVMLKNIARAKYELCWMPIVRVVLAPHALDKVSFDAYFNHVLMHEVSHGLGPGFIIKNGKETTVSKELKNLYSTIEECKADVLGMTTLEQLIRKGVYTDLPLESIYASYLGGMFRSIRFGIDEAHGAGVAIQFNFLLEKGGFFETADGRLDYDAAKLKSGLQELAARLLIIEATGDYEAAAQLIERYKRRTPLMDRFLRELKDAPIDIRPIFAVEATGGTL